MSANELSEILYKKTIYQALSESVCIKCETNIQLIKDSMTLNDKLEYETSALCPVCYKNLFNDTLEDQHEMITLQGKR